jgi:hypothetical protein
MSSEDLEAVVNTERLLVTQAIGLAHIILMLVLGCLAVMGIVVGYFVHIGAPDGGSLAVCCPAVQEEDWHSFR